MFYIYDIDGLQFRGPLEALEENRKVEQSRPINPVQADSQEQSQQSYGSGSQAVSVYQRMLQQNGMVEPLVHIHQIMSSPVSTIGPDISLREAWQMLRDGNIRQLVVTTERRAVMGLLSDRDILRHMNVIGEDIEVRRDLTVGDIIDQETITTDSMSDIRRVARVLAFYHMDALPVINEGRLVGIVTRGDILRGFAENPKLNLWA